MPEKFCPTCWSPLTEDKTEGRQVLRCPNHGELNFSLNHHPLSKSDFAKHCDSMGITNLERPF